MRRHGPRVRGTLRRSVPSRPAASQTRKYPQTIHPTTIQNNIAPAKIAVHVTARTIRTGRVSTKLSEVAVSLFILRAL
jgi:hypothetical protein